MTPHPLTHPPRRWWTLSILLAIAVIAWPRIAPAAGDPLPLQAAIAQDIFHLDREIADLVIRRASVPPAQRATFDLDLDLRIIHRWMYEQLSRAEDADLQAALWARILAMGEARRHLDDIRRAAGGQAWTRTQSEAMVRLHQLSFKLPNLQSIGELDKLSADIGSAMLNIASPTPVNPVTLPAMRPKRETSQRQQTNRELTLSELIQEAQTAPVGPGLRVQLVNIGRLAQEAADVDADSEEATRLTRLLRDAMGMVRGLASNTGVSPENRLQLETQLAEALALSSDPRLKEIGAARMEVLRPYRQTLTRIGQLQLTPALRQRFAPAMAWASANPSDSDKVFDALQAYVELSQQREKLPKEPPVEPSLRKSFEQMSAALVESDEAFLTAAASLTGGGGVFGMGPDELVSEAKRMRRLVELLELVGEAPATIKLLEGYRPRPMGGLERRMQGLAIAVASPAAVEARHNNERTFRAVMELGRLARTLEQNSMSSLPQQQAAPYTQGYAQGFDQRWRAIVQEQATVVASGQEINPDRLTELRRMADLVEAVREAITLSGDPGNWAALSRWVDWTMTRRQFESILTPLQQQLASAVRAAAEGTNHDSAELQRLRARYNPIVAFVRRAHSRGEQCAELPDGMTGAAAKLVTPLASVGEPERFAGLAALVWMHGDVEQADAALRAMAARVAPAVGMRYREGGRRGGR